MNLLALFKCINRSTDLLIHGLNSIMPSIHRAANSQNKHRL